MTEHIYTNTKALEQVHFHSKGANTNNIEQHKTWTVQDHCQWMLVLKWKLAEMVVVNITSMMEKKIHNYIVSETTGPIGTKLCNNDVCEVSTKKSSFFS